MINNDVVPLYDCIGLFIEYIKFPLPNCYVSIFYSRCVFQLDSFFLWVKSKPWGCMTTNHNKKYLLGYTAVFSSSR